MQRQQSGGLRAGCWPAGQAAQRTVEQSTFLSSVWAPLWLEAQADNARTPANNANFLRFFMDPSFLAIEPCKRRTRV